MTTTPRPAYRPSATPSDTVLWNDRVSAPIIIPITAAAVLFCIFLLCIVKCLKKLWDKKKRSDAYEITDLIHEKDMAKADIPALDGSHDLDVPDHPNLNLVTYSGEKRFRRRSLDLDLESGGSDSRSPSAAGNGLIRIEAKVHDSSNENNDFDEVEEQEPHADQPLLSSHNNHHVHNDSNHSSVPIVVGLETKALRHNNAPLAPTESEV